MTTVQLPHDHALEQAVLGAVFLDATQCEDAFERLDADDFYVRAHRELWAVCMDCWRTNKPLTPVVIRSALEARGQLEAVGGMEYVAELLDHAPTAANVAFHAGMLQHRALERRLLQVAGAIQSLVQARAAEGEPLAAECERLLLDATAEHIPRHGALVRDLAWPVVDRLQDRRFTPGHLLGVTTGAIDLDAKTAGWQAGDFVIIAARPSVGKTTVLLHNALAAAADGKRVGVFSIEMNRDQLVERMLASLSGLDILALRKAALRDDEWPRLAKAVHALTPLPIFIDDEPSRTITQLRAAARRAVREHQLDVVMIDYLGLIHPDKERENQNQNVTAIAKGLKTLARELRIPVVVASQLSRGPEMRPDRRPRLSDLRDSGSIEQDADVVLMLWKDPAWEKATHPPLTVLIEKQRNGPVGVVQLAFDPASCRLSDWSAIMPTGPDHGP